MAQRTQNRLVSLTSHSGLRIQRCRGSCGVGHRCRSDLEWLWLWCKPVATALIQPLALGPPYAAGAALKSKNDNNNVIQNLHLRNSVNGKCELPRFYSSLCMWCFLTGPCWATATRR